MNRSGLLLVSALALGGYAQVAVSDTGGANWSLSGWLNEGMTWYSDGAGSDVVQTSDNITGSRLMLTGNTDLMNSGLNAGFELWLEPRSGNLLGTNQDALGDDTNAHSISIIVNSIHLQGSFGKLTLGLQSMPTDNIAVLADPSLTFWSSVTPVLRGNGFTIQNGGGAVWGNFLNCLTAPGLRGGSGIGLDCNGPYRQGLRYDLPAFGPLSVALGYANDDIYDIAAKYNGTLGGLTTLFHLGYAINQGVNPGAVNLPTGGLGAADFVYHTKARNIQTQLGLMDPGTGLFASIAWQYETATVSSATRAQVNRAARSIGLAATPRLSDRTQAWWTKAGVKRAFNRLGDTILSVQYGHYNDQYGPVQAALGVSGSTMRRLGLSIDQYFGSRLLIYGAYQNFSLEVEGSARAKTTYGNTSDLHLFNLGLTFFF